jgi:hypothetical protein
VQLSFLVLVINKIFICIYVSNINRFLEWQDEIQLNLNTAKVHGQVYASSLSNVFIGSCASTASTTTGAALPDPHR